MAGDWIKFEHATPDKPEVVKMSDILGIDQDAVVGKLVRLWIWSDSQSLNGHALSVTKKFLDRLVYCEGFANALIQVGWLIESEEGISFPNFERHNGKSSKNRSLTADRKRKQRGEIAKEVTEESRSDRDGSVTREEKRRDNNNVEGKIHSGYVGEPPKPAPAQNFDGACVSWINRMKSLVPEWGKTKLNRWETKAAVDAYKGSTMTDRDFDLLKDYFASKLDKDRRGLAFPRPVKREKLFENLGDWLASAERWRKETGWRHKDKADKPPEPRQEQDDSPIGTPEDLAAMKRDAGL